jgi:cleavage and polyadenylation specificity factor subunit 2
VSTLELLYHTYALQYEDSEIAFIKGRISLPTNSGIPVLEPLRISNRANEDVDMENGDASVEVTTVPRAVMIGDLKLTSLKNRLNRLGISADFAGEGILVCRSVVDGEVDTVAVKKTSKGQVRVEGDASALFYAVREEIYKLHALVETE